jgi:hypothetical protein
LSKSVPVIFGDAMFWAHDVALGVLFIEAARVGAETLADLRPWWWSELEHGPRTHALVGSSFAVQLDEFGVEQRQVLLNCVVEASRRMEGPRRRGPQRGFDPARVGGERDQLPARCRAHQ